MKKIILMFGIVFALVLTSMTVYANMNYLRTITLEKSTTGYNIVLDTDNVAKVTRKVISDNEIILELNGVTSSDTVNAFYKGINDVDSLVVENSSPNKIKIYITAPEIKTSSVIMQTQNNESLLIGETIPISKTVWAGIVIGIFLLAFAITNKKTKETNNLFAKRDIKEREIELYRQYRKNMEVKQNYNDIKMRNMIKKIDRKIDERLTLTLK